MALLLLLAILVLIFGLLWTKNKLYGTIEVYEYDNDIRENAIGLKNEYGYYLFDLGLCEFKKDELY